MDTILEHIRNQQFWIGFFTFPILFAIAIGIDWLISRRVEKKLSERDKVINELLNMCKDESTQHSNDKI